MLYFGGNYINSIEDLTYMDSSSLNWFEFNHNKPLSDFSHIVRLRSSIIEHIYLYTTSMIKKSC